MEYYIKFLTNVQIEMGGRVRYFDISGLHTGNIFPWLINLVSGVSAV